MTPDDLIRARFGTLPFAPPLEIPPALAALLDRRVTRRYRAEAIDDALLDTVLLPLSVLTVLGVGFQASGARALRRWTIVPFYCVPALRSWCGWELCPHATVLLVGSFFV